MIRERSNPRNSNIYNEGKDNTEIHTDKTNRLVTLTALPESPTLTLTLKAQTTDDDNLHD